MMLTPSLLPDQDDLRERLQPTLQALARTGAIPTLPTAATRALSLARNPDVDAGALCKVLRTDLALTARILRLANSALYARRAPARSIEEAVLFLGVRKTSDLVVTASSRRLYDADGDAADQWTHSLLTAIAAEELASALRWRDPASAFLPGLFHDVGRIVFMLVDRQSLASDPPVDVPPGADVLALERDTYGFTHAEAGAALAEGWGLPAKECDAVRWHHEPERATDGASLAELLHAADRLAHAVHGAPDAAPLAEIFDAVGVAPDDAARCAERVQQSHAEQAQLLA